MPSANLTTQICTSYLSSLVVLRRHNIPSLSLQNMHPLTSLATPLGEKPFNGLLGFPPFQNPLFKLFTPLFQALSLGNNWTVSPRSWRMWTKYLKATNFRDSLASLFVTLKQSTASIRQPLTTAPIRACTD